MGTAADRPTRVRHGIVALAALVAVLLYLDRICLSTADQYVREGLGLSKAQMGWAYSAFFWAYALAQIPAGWLGDRYSVRAVLTFYAVAWSVCTGLTGLAQGFLALFLLRLGVGLFEAGAYPVCNTLLSRWVPPARRGVASSVVAVGGRLGGALAPVLTVYVIAAWADPAAPARLAAGDILDPPLLAAQLAEPPTPKAREVQRLLGGAAPRDAAAQAEALNAVIAGPDLAGGERANRLWVESAFPQAVRKVYGDSWRRAMVVFGVAGLAVAAVFWWLFRDRPREHPRVNAAEAELIEAGRPPAAAGRPGPPPLRAMAADFSLGMNSLSQFMTNFYWVFLITLFPRYLADMHGVPAEARGWMQGLPIFVGMAGMLAGGWLTDAATARLGLRWGRGLPVAGSRAVVVLAFAACLWHPSAWTVTLLMAAVAAFTDLGNPSAWAYAQDVGGRHVGAVVGWFNMWGNLGAAVSPVALTAVEAAYGWDGLFAACAAASLVSGLAALAIDARRPIAAG